MDSVISLVLIGTEALAAITPIRVETTNISLNRFEPSRRDCYQEKEFQLPILNWGGGYR
jgi:hypothetical protein